MNLGISLVSRVDRRRGYWGMARKPRIEFAGAVYYVIIGRDRGEAIYQEDEDRRRLLHFLGEVCDGTGWLIHAFIVMTNHYHLLLETPEANLVVGMKWLQGTYTQRFNLRRGHRGRLFQGRYKVRESYPRNELQDHDEGQAPKMLQRGLGVLGGKESYLEAKAKGALEKQLLAWWLRRKTVVSRRWIGERLGMGDLSRVTSAVRKVDSGKESEIRRWKMQLEGNS